MMAEINSPDYVVMTGDRQDEGKMLSDGTRVQYDDQICEGTKVIYKNKLYDYSL